MVSTHRRRALTRRTLLARVGAQRGPFCAQIVKTLADDPPYLSLIDRQDHSLASARFDLQSTFWKEGPSMTGSPRST